MTISPGQPWGSAFHRDVAGEHTGEDLPIVGNDSDLAAFATAHPGSRVRLVGGDLFRTLGAPDSGRLDRGEAVAFPIDLLEVDVGDGTRRLAAAHVVARRGSLWVHRTVVVMNASFIGPLNLGPKAHPNDGRADATDGRLAARDRWSARGRMAAGTHLPHPELKVSRSDALSFDLDRPSPLFLDGVSLGPVRRFTVRVIPDALEVVA